jgi:hypothetical protein
MQGSNDLDARLEIQWNMLLSQSNNLNLFIRRDVFTFITTPIRPGEL